MPGQGTGVWLFADLTGANTQTLDILVNGQSVASTAQATQVGQAGLLALIDPAPAAGSTIQVQAQDQQGNQIPFNAITVGSGPYSSANIPPSFVANSPPDGATGVGTSPTFDYSAAGSASGGYNIICFELAQTSSGGVGIADIPVAVVVSPGTTSFTVGSAATAVFNNSSLNPQGQAFAWHVVALDSTGWGIGTTIDVAGFNAQNQAAYASWPWFGP